MGKIPPKIPPLSLETVTDMQSIPTLDEAIDACDTLRRFLEGVDATFRRSRVRQEPPAPPAEPAESTGKTAPHASDKTATWPDRVREILREAIEPLTASEIIRLYNERHHSEESPEKIGNRIRSVLWQLKGRGQLSHDEPSGTYRLKESPP